MRCKTPAEHADQRRGDDDRGERRVESEDRDECRRREDPQRRMLQRARPDAPRRSEDDRYDRWLDAVEDARDERHVAVRKVDPRERDQDEYRGQHEQGARDDAAPYAVHHPADIGRELRRFRTGQHHAVVERVQEAVFGDPAPAFHQFRMHDRDLAGRPAEADEAELEPEAECLGEGNGRGWRGVDAICRCVQSALLQQPAELGRTGVLGPRESAIPRLGEDARDRGRVSTLPSARTREPSERSTERFARTRT